MSDDQDNARSQRLHEILAAYLQSVEAGRPPSREELLAQQPELAAELSEFLAQRETLADLTAGRDDATLPPASRLDEAATLPPQSRTQESATLAPASVAGEATLPPGDSSAELPRPGTKVRYFGDYELLEEIARGGMGVVYKARQISLNRIVALKLILAGQLASEQDIRRFRAEAVAAANLDHPGIVAIYEVGEQQGQQFFSMAFIEGESLAGKVARGPLAPREAAEIIRAVTEAAQYAHERGVIHRDLKPANILLDAAGHPRITDFGLAKRVTGDSNLTASGQVMGTPSYMPPEQAAGKRHEIQPVSDVYALGAVLYTLLTGRPPFQAATPLDTLYQVLEQEPVAPRRLNARVPKDLETICFKAMEKDPANRYRTAGDMGADLDRYLNGFSIRARRVSPVGRTLRWVNRSRTVAASLVGVVALALVATLFAYWSHVATVKLIELKLEQALIAALVGEFDRANKLIDETEQLGAEPGRVQMLRGQVAFHCNDTEKAVHHLHAAVNLLPRSPAARAMLAVAYWQNLKWEECENALADLDELPPVTPEDYLFKGYAEATRDPSRGLDSINEAVRLRPNWTMARALGAEVRSWYAQDKADARVLEQAREDARIVKTLLPDKPIGPLVSLYANLVAATIYVDQPDKHRDALAAAKQDFESLGSFPDSGWSAFMRYRYLEYSLEYREQDDAYRKQEYEALQEMDRARGKVRSAWPATLYALVLYRRGKCQEALQVLDGLAQDDLGAFQDIMRMYLLPELPEGYQKAVRAYQDARGRYEGTSLLFQHTVLYLLGQKKEAAAKYREMQLPKVLADARGGSYAKLLEYNRGRGSSIDAVELLNAVKDSKYHECNAHFFIAMSLLADGDRTGARKHFAGCVATGCFDFDASDWSRTFLVRMHEDPNWPRWIPPKQSAEPQQSPPESPRRSPTGEPAKP
ncbi:MAG: protein kinase [Planctomycetota bacterium]|nr:protein kinase [Planctomycetota bacterium]